MSPVPKAWLEIMEQETAGGILTGPAQPKKNFVWSNYQGLEENLAERVSTLGNGEFKRLLLGSGKKTKGGDGKAAIGMFWKKLYSEMKGDNPTIGLTNEIIYNKVKK